MNVQDICKAMEALSDEELSSVRRLATELQGKRLMGESVGHQAIGSSAQAGARGIAESLYALSADELMIVAKQAMAIRGKRSNERVEDVTRKAAQFRAEVEEDKKRRAERTARETAGGYTPPKAAPAQPKYAPVQPQDVSGEVRYADESMTSWVMMPGEKSLCGRHEVFIFHPIMEQKYSYYMEVTNKRILLTRESSGSKNAGYVMRMGGGLLGSLIAEGIKAAVGSGPKPYLEIPLTAVSSCGQQNKNEFYIMADQTYVLKNNRYEDLLPALVSDAKAGRG